MHLDLNISKDHYNMLSFIEEFNPRASKDASYSLRVPFTWYYSRPLLVHGDVFQEFHWMPETMDSTNLTHTMFSHTHIPFHLKGALDHFSLAYPNCQHSCALGTLLSKIRVTWTQALIQVGIIIKMTKWLTGRYYIQRLSAGQRDDSHPWLEEVRKREISSHYSDQCTI